MNLSKFPKPLLVLGLGLIAFGFVWPWLIGGRVSYSAEDAKEYQRASMDLHNRIHGHGSHDNHDHQSSQPNTVSDEMLKSAWSDYDQAVGKRDAELNRGKLSGMIAKVLGCLCAAAGVVVYFIVRDGE